MRRSPAAGLSLIELLLAIVLMGAIVLAIGPLVVRAGAAMTRGRVLLEGIQLTNLRRALETPAPGAGCGSGGAGIDSGRLAALTWRTATTPSGLAFEATIADQRSRFPAESLTALMPCQP